LTYVWGGSAWQQVSGGTAVGNSGLVYITSGSLSGTTTNFVGCFTSTYDNYRIVLSSCSMSGDGDIYWRGLVGSTAGTTADYSFAMNGLITSGTSFNATNAAASLGYTGVSAVGGVGNVIVGSSSIDFYGPKLTQRTFATVNGMGYYSGFYGRSGMTHFNLTTSFDGIQFLSATASTMSGTVTIYGYRK